MLSALVGRTVKITKAGREFKGCCPFHNEKSPSFTVNDAKGFYHCFGCGVHGDAIRFLTEHHGMAFMDAVRDLAQQVGMTVPENTATPEDQAKAEGKKPAPTMRSRAAVARALKALALPGEAPGETVARLVWACGTAATREQISRAYFGI